MKYNTELGKQLVDELIDLWIECRNKCDEIEELVKQLKEKSNIKIKVGFLNTILL